MRANAPAGLRRSLFPLVLVTALMACILLAGSGEPRSHGHSLSYWLDHYTTRATEEDRRLANQAQAAIREIGTNALPTLLAWLRYEPSQTKTNIVSFLARIR